MRIGARKAWAAATLALFATVAARPAAAEGSDILLALHGHWEGDGIRILIDTERMQGNVDPLKPFTRTPLVIRNVTPPWVVFAIGISTFVARIEGETMTITQPGWPAPRVIARRPESRRSPQEQDAGP